MSDAFRADQNENLLIQATSPHVAPVFEDSTEFAADEASVWSENHSPRYGLSENGYSFRQGITDFSAHRMFRNKAQCAGNGGSIVKCCNAVAGHSVHALRVGWCAPMAVLGLLAMTQAIPGEACLAMNAHQSTETGNTLSEGVPIFTQTIATAMFFAPNRRHTGCEFRGIFEYWCNTRVNPKFFSCAD